MNIAPRQKKRVAVLPQKVEVYVPESKVFTKLSDFEKRLDSTIIRKRNEIQEASLQSRKVERKLRIFVSNSSAYQPYMMDTSIAGEPSWTLKIEGKLQGGNTSNASGVGSNGGGAAVTADAFKFSHFIKSMVVSFADDLENDGTKNNIVEWRKSLKTAATDGFEIKRLGSENVPVKIVIHLDFSPEKFTLDDRLARVIGVHSDTKARIVLAVWQYVKINKLQDPTDKKFINNDETLKGIFGVEKMQFTSIAERILPLLLPIEPIVIDYIIRVDKPFHFSPVAFDVTVECDEKSGTGNAITLAGNHQDFGDKEIMALDHKISELLNLVNKSKMKREFMQAFAENPVDFINDWVSSQSRDIETVLGDYSVSFEASRKAKFYDPNQDWLTEAVAKYLTNNTHQKMAESAQTLSSRQ